ncbi:unnamed protein product [Didymodactylos carnosus]|uniref:G-protein coupled receptors family 1 profile domain-containing protein n=1 Tax=Didymodactylos carnosus TaxID=1234261 RepID=A0A814J1R7_9BILA|nr:unnamed protein product [Didymodactylos carnosus]CAF1476265.1 unnamed protein product [Didymodactylos carnosus]CAF3804162.1 unnamed protein product [Didymodactylos carnosus]CAF4267314.1 unnamed protein product [Didymodactylos carnosus]
MLTSEIFGIIVFCNISIATLLFLLIFLIVYINRQQFQQHISILLTVNTCLASFLTCFAVIIMTSSNLFGSFLIANMNFCYVWGLLYDVFECSIYHSYALQAFFRLCRVIFYKKKYLLKYRLYIRLIGVQWMLSFLLLLPAILLKHYTQLSNQKYCLIAYTDVPMQIYVIFILYAVPLICIVITYLCITFHIRRTSTATITVTVARRQRQNLRDLTVLRQIVLLITILAILRLPTVIFMADAAIAHQLYEFTYEIVGLITSVCLIIIAIITLYITPQIRNLIKVIQIRPTTAQMPVIISSIELANNPDSRLTAGE